MFIATDNQSVRANSANELISQSGLLMCAKYAFPPNALHYCGPEKQDDLLGYRHGLYPDSCAQDIIKQFQTLYPYLVLIAGENNISDPLDPRVVEAYWIGNALLHNVSMRNFHRHFVDGLHLKKKIPKKEFELLTGKFAKGALPHHTFHVLNVFTRTGHHMAKHTLETMDACRIGWGKVVQKDPLSVETNPLMLQNGELSLGKPVVKQIHIPIASSLFPVPCSLYVSFHWNQLCDVVTESQVRQLSFYTKKAIEIANMSR